MEKYFQRSLGTMFLVSLFLGMAGADTVYAATTPSLGLANTYTILSSTYTNTVAGTTVMGDIGFTTPPAVAPGGVQTNYGSGVPYATAGIDQGSALALLAAQPCTFTFAPGAIDLATDVTHGPIGVYTPGVYCTAAASAASIGVGGITLSGAGTYIFRINGALTTVATSVVTLAGASACDVFWTPTAATTLGATSTFVGTNIDNAGITIGSTVTWTGRALAFGGTVSTDVDTLTAPVCALPPAAGGGGRRSGTINVVKTVINDNGGTKTTADFPLFVDNTLVISGETNSFSPGTYAVTETSNTQYTTSFSGDCDSTGHLDLNMNYDKFCIITNNDIGPAAVAPPVPPLIDVVKAPNPLALPNGPGMVEYTYITRNIGTVPMSNVTMVGDTCKPIVLASGDNNGDSKLDVSETWTYRCSTRLTETHTNTVVATGWANGLSAVDIASATVVVGLPVLPPLIHVTKIPRPLLLLNGGGMVTYIERVSNPGTVALNNVTLTDNTCSPMRYIGGDRNRDKKLDPTETWRYTCRTRVSTTTTNTAIATGTANGITVRDFAIATVVVAAPVPTIRNAAPVTPTLPRTVTPALPRTGFEPKR
jgi:hypothetical protein